MDGSAAVLRLLRSFSIGKRRDGSCEYSCPHTVLVCLQLSSKFHERRPLETRDLLLLTTKPIPRDQLREYEQRLLHVTDFNLVIPHILTLIDEMAEGESASKLHFLCELLAMKDYRIFFDGEKIRRLLVMVMGG